MRRAALTQNSGVVRHGFAPAAALLVDSGRRSLGAAGALSPVGTPEWRALPDAAERHGLTAFVQTSLAAWPDVPEVTRDLLAHRARLQRMRALHAVSWLTSLTERLQREGVNAVAIKGPLFSRWLYGDAGMRRFADLDLLIDRAHRGLALQVLGAAGYSLPGHLSAAAARTVYAGTGAWPLRHDTAIGLDVHWNVQAAGFASPLESREVLRDSVSTGVAGVEIRIPGPTHAATLALLHAAKHLWASLELLLSIAHLMRRADIDWNGVYELVARAGAWNGAAAGLVLAGDLFDVEPPPALRDRIRLRRVQPLVRAAEGFLAMPDVAGASRRSEIGAHCAALDSPRGRLRYALWRLLVPTPLDAAWWRLPDRLLPLYAPLRLLRLAVRGQPRDH